MNLTIISGSHRNNSQSTRVSHIMKKRVEELALFDEVNVLDLADNPLPLWDESIWEGSEEWRTLLAPWRATLKASDAFIVVTPEWGGMVPAALKNFFLIFGAIQLGHKPAMITSISSSIGGTYPVQELRSSSYKNNRICYIPEHLIIRNVESLMTGEKPEEDEYYSARIDYNLNLLNEYSKALKLVRDSGVVDHKTWSNGM
ncbi:NADPH-dependent oxidoreductase [Endozoicomonas sp. OPT23]|uniref:NADPH-dependent FMN reductase n=1 Tax=Endozoicomonas sp. OPT23 TaxID=2072845 RepID=UPI00129A2334|nr:NAD(P)H-dependent oxidoreductase [Endozoicomonas sp. OPT23]MRI35397.1 NADPH-dependent oxidoreductase [Endozoicomonas sp. OPT23]